MYLVQYYCARSETGESVVWWPDLRSQQVKFLNSIVEFFSIFGKDLIVSFWIEWNSKQVSPSLMMKICDHNCSDDAGFYKDFVVLLWEKLLKNPFYGRYTTTLQTNHPPYGLPLPPPPQVFLDANETIVVRHQDSKTHMVFFRSKMYYC